MVSNDFLTFIETYTETQKEHIKAVWNKYAANKITVTIIKSWRVMIKTEIYLINFENKLTDDFEIAWKIQEKVCLLEGKESVYKGFALIFSKRN